MSLRCHICGESQAPESVTGRLLSGDLFVQYKCAGCSEDGHSKLERLPMNWVSIIHLVLYHLHQTEPNKHGFYRWKEDICRLIEERWNDLCPKRTPSGAWTNSISSILSANPTLFVNGFNVMRQSGWWALKEVVPPKVPEAPADGRKRRGQVALLEEDTDEIEVETPKPTRILTNTSSPMQDIQPAQPTKDQALAAEEIKRKLVERLLKVDSELLKAALSKDPSTKPLQPIMYIPQQSHPTQTSQQPPKKKAKPTNYVRAAPHENELTDVTNRITNPDERIRRLKRKLSVRRIKRMNGLPLFDIDNWIYLYLKAGNDPLKLLEASAPNLLEGLKTQNDTGSKPDDSLIREGAASSIVQAELSDIPYLRDPSLSFLAKLVGIMNLPGYPFEVESPYTGNMLPPYLVRLKRTLPPYVSLLRDIRKERIEEDTIDVCHLRKEHLAQVNRLLRSYFWPSIDVAESLEYPDYSFVLMYRKMVVGCALCSPEGYLSYLFVHPLWRGTGLASVLLYFVDRSLPVGRDITVHVSVGNPAVILYQKWGFKPEEFIVDFYSARFRSADVDESLGPDPASRNAFFLRLRR